MEITEIESRINNLETKLLLKNTTEGVVVEHWSISKGWKLFQWLKTDFKIESPHKITKHTTWTNGRCEFKEVVKTSYAVSGKVKGRFMCGIHASVTAYTQKRIKYSREIDDLKKRLAEKKTSLKNAEQNGKNLKRNTKKVSRNKITRKIYC